MYHFGNILPEMQLLIWCTLVLFYSGLMVLGIGVQTSTMDGKNLGEKCCKFLHSFGAFVVIAA
jgi:hypothetical protein